MIKATPRVPARWGQEIFVGADKEALSEEDEFAWLPPNAIRRRSRCRKLYTYIHTYIIHIAETL